MLSRQDALPSPVADDVGDTDLRVFLQCMEMKKEGPRNLTERDCRVLARQSSNVVAAAARAAQGHALAHAE